MKLGIFAKTFAGTHPDQVLGAVAHAGFSAAQYNMACSGLAAMPDAIAPDAARAVAAAARANGIDIAAVSGTYNMIHPDPVVRETGQRRLAVIAAAAAAMGTGLVTLCTGTRDPHDQWAPHPDNGSAAAWHDLVAAMIRAAATAERHGVNLGVEPELANVVDSAAKAERLIAEIGSPRLKIVLDPANLFETATGAEQHRVVGDAIDRLGPQIVLAHAKDRAPDGSFTTAGSGVLDYPFYLQRLRAIGFSGALITHGLGADEAAPVAGFLARIRDAAL